MAELPAMDLFGALLFQVVGQQLSVAATRRTLGRIEVLFGGRLPSPAELLGVPPDSLRQAGLSWRKVAFDAPTRSPTRRCDDRSGTTVAGMLSPTILVSMSPRMR